MHLYRLSVEERKAAREQRRRTIMDRDKIFMYGVINECLGIKPSSDIRVLDFGCGKGEMAGYLADQGYSAHGCDIEAYWKAREDHRAVEFALITNSPYRLPYSDNFFDVVISTSVFEHVLNKEESFQEIHRVLKTGGYSVHFLPSKWYLPQEPHIRIPLVNILWPNVPRWWLQLWVLLRIPIAPKLRHSWKQMVETYVDYCKQGISYVSNARYRYLSIAIFGNYNNLNDYYIGHAGGGIASLARRLPFRKVTAWLISQFRMNLFCQRKE